MTSSTLRAIPHNGAAPKTDTYSVTKNPCQHRHRSYGRSAEGSGETCQNSKSSERSTVKRNHVGFAHQRETTSGDGATPDHPFYDRLFSEISGGASLLAGSCRITITRGTSGPREAWIFVVQQVAPQWRAAPRDVLWGRGRTPVRILARETVYSRIGGPLKIFVAFVQPLYGTKSKGNPFGRVDGIIFRGMDSLGTVLD